MNLMISLDRKALLFLISNSISIALGFLLYLVIISSSDGNLSKLMLTYSIHLILGSILTFGLNLYLFNNLMSLKKDQLKLTFIKNNNLFIFQILTVGLLIVLILSGVDLIKAPYKKNFNLPLWPIFFGSLILAFNKIVYFCFLGFKFYNKCCLIIITRPSILLASIIFFTFKSNISFEIFVAGSFIVSEIFVLLISLDELKKINFFQINFSKKFNVSNLKNSLKLFGDYIFAEVILKIDIFFSMIKFDIKNISTYLISLVFIEGMLTFTIILRNYFSSQYGTYISSKNYDLYLAHYRRFALFSFFITLFFVFCSFFVLFILQNYLITFDEIAFKYLLIMCIGYLIFSIFGVSELIFLNRNNYLKQTYYFLTAFFVQLLCIIFLINKIGILAFPISICIMFLIMSILIFLEFRKIGI